jgi:hypothetical protein
MSEARGCRCPTGAGSGLERTVPGLGWAGLSSDGFCAQALPAAAAARAARAAGPTTQAPPFRCDLMRADNNRSAFKIRPRLRNDLRTPFTGTIIPARGSRRHRAYG